MAAKKKALNVGPNILPKSIKATEVPRSQYIWQMDNPGERAMRELNKKLVVAKVQRITKKK